MSNGRLLKRRWNLYTSCELINCQHQYFFVMMEYVLILIEVLVRRIHIYVWSSNIDSTHILYQYEFLVLLLTIVMQDEVIAGGCAEWRVYMEPLLTIFATSKKICIYFKIKSYNTHTHTCTLGKTKNVGLKRLVS